MTTPMPSTPAELREAIVRIVDERLAGRDAGLADYPEAAFAARDAEMIRRIHLGMLGAQQ